MPPPSVQVSVRCTKHHREHLLIQGSPPGRWARQQCRAFSGTAYFPGWDPGSLARHTRPGPIGSLPTSGFHLFLSCLSAPHAIRSPGPFPDAARLPFPQWSVQFHACFRAIFWTKMYISYLLHLPPLNLLVSADFALSWHPEPTTLTALATPVVIDELWKSLPGEGALLHQMLSSPGPILGEASTVPSKCGLDVMFPECSVGPKLQKRKVSSEKSKVHMVKSSDLELFPPIPKRRIFSISRDPFLWGWKTTFSHSFHLFNT